jgi:hypothetical protein
MAVLAKLTPEQTISDHMHGVEKRVLQRDMTANSPPAQSQPGQVKASASCA